MLSTKNVESKIEFDMSHFLLTLFNLDATIEFNLLNLHEPIIIVLYFYLLPTGYFTSYNFYKEDGLITEA